MANDKEIIKKLFAVVQKQQKIIVKMAEGTPFTGQGEPPPASLNPNVTPKDPVTAVFAARPDLKNLMKLKARGSDVELSWLPTAPEDKKDENFKAVLDKMSELGFKGFNLKEV